jgi:uncharacterized SAM-binding protein YcdF (DUF218 family)
VGFGRRRWGRWLAGIALAALAVLAMPFTASLLTAPMEQAYPPLDIAAAQKSRKAGVTIVVLGGGRDLGALEYPDAERLSNASLRRARYGALLARVLDAPLAVSGGRPTGRHSEAALMKQFIETELRQPVALAEEDSLDTMQNALFLGRRLIPAGGRDVILVTDVSHMPRAARTFRSAGFNVVAAPTHYSAGAPTGALDFLPTADGLERSTRILRELLGEAWYRLRGRPQAGQA